MPVKALLAGGRGSRLGGAGSSSATARGGWRSRCSGNARVARSSQGGEEIGQIWWVQRWRGAGGDRQALDLTAVGDGYGETRGRSPRSASRARPRSVADAR
ncbi:uncharacterized protein M6B38_120390 [Iris pallida]|uniref:MobA-like NTP transferase domain-containing protein n=1 Tax=Iris pallida TaxID=29817 RepID=A0AAX6H9P0_IRIPA|nr:uncharacterized protein M6B38_120390 [Iris pallida]